MRIIWFVGQLALTAIVLAAVTSTEEGHRLASTFFAHDAQASDDMAPNREVITEKSPCSTAEVVAKVKSLSGDLGLTSFGPLTNISFVLDAIRTVSSSPTLTVCEARLTYSYDVNIPTRLPQEGPAPPGTPTTRKTRVNEPKELTYKVEKTDDGQDYITIVPSDADIRDQQNADQRARELQYEMQQRGDRFYEQDSQRFYERQQRLLNGQ